MVAVIRKSLYVFVGAYLALLPLLAAANDDSGRDIPERNIYVPVLATLGNGVEGSGFYLTCKSNLFFVTAKHVLFDEKGTLRSTNATFSSCSEEDLEVRIAYDVNLDALHRDNRIRFHASNDVVVVHLGEVFIKANGEKGTIMHDVYTRRIDTGKGVMIACELSQVKRFSEVFVGNEVFVFGYPRSIGLRELPQFDYDRPLLRRGTVAGKHSKRRTIILDCPVYPGISGGPVLEVEREGFVTHFVPIGVVAEFVPFAEQWENRKLGYSNLTISNSGYAVITSMDSVLELLEYWHETLDKPAPSKKN